MARYSSARQSSRRPWFSLATMDPPTIDDRLIDEVYGINRMVAIRTSSSESKTKLLTQYSRYDCAASVVMMMEIGCDLLDDFKMHITMPLEDLHRHRRMPLAVPCTGRARRPHGPRQRAFASARWGLGLPTFKERLAAAFSDSSVLNSRSFLSGTIRRRWRIWHC